MAAERKLRMGMVGGGPGAFIGPVHRIAAELDGKIELVAGAFSQSAERSREAGESYKIDPDRAYANYQEMLEAERRRHDAGYIAEQIHFFFSKAIGHPAADGKRADQVVAHAEGTEDVGRYAEIDQLLFHVEPDLVPGQMVHDVRAAEPRGMLQVGARQRLYRGHAALDFPSRHVDGPGRNVGERIAFLTGKAIDMDRPGLYLAFFHGEQDQAVQGRERLQGRGDGIGDVGQFQRRVHNPRDFEQEPVAIFMRSDFEFGHDSHFTRHFDSAK